MTFITLVPTIYYNVKQYGAVGDGLTDDTSAIQSAINASAAGSAIFFPAGTYIVSATIQLLGGRTYIGEVGLAGQGPVIQQASSINLPAVMAGYDWYNNNSTTGVPLKVANLTIDGNSAHNTSTHGLVLMNANCEVSECTAQNTPGAGIICTSVSRNGTNISNTSVEDRIEKCKTISTGSYGIYIQDNLGKCTDGFLIDNIVQGPGDQAIRLDRAAGWSIEGNHMYGCPVDGIVANNCFGTRICNNYVDGFGSSSTPGFYNGILATILGSVGTVIEGNVISNTEQDGTNYQYLNVVGHDGSRDTHAVVIGNTIQGGYVNTTATTSLVSGAKTPCAPKNMSGITVGNQLFVDNEAVIVASVTSTSFTPTTNWANNHGPSAYPITPNHSPSYSFGLLYSEDSSQQASGLPFTITALGNRVSYVGQTVYQDAFVTLGPVTVDGPLAMTQSATAPAVASSGTITTSGVGVARVAPAGAVTGVILQPGTYAGQMVAVINESIVANSVTFAASGTSNVAGGTSVVIAGLAKLILVYDTGTHLWY